MWFQLDFDIPIIKADSNMQHYSLSIARKYTIFQQTNPWQGCFLVDDSERMNFFFFF